MKLVPDLNKEKVAAMLKAAVAALKTHAKAAAIAAVVLLLAASVIWVRPAATRWLSARRERKALLPYQYIEYATEVLVPAQRFDEAFTYLQAAIDKLTMPEERADAGLIMAEFLIERARVEPDPYAQMARGYLVASLNLEQRPGQRFKMYTALGKAAELLREWDAAMKAYENAKAVAGTDPERAEIILKRLDIFLQTGSWDQFNAEWETIGNLNEQEEWHIPFAIRELRMLDRVLTDDRWYQAWVARQDAPDPVTIRAELLDYVLAMCDELAVISPDFADEALFTAIKLCVAENRFVTARERISDYFEKNYRAHQEEILLLLIRMARLEGKQRRSEELITQFLRRYQWFARASEELLAVIAQAESVGHYQEALEILEEYLRMPAAQDRLEELYFKAGELAQRLQLYDRALRHYDKALENNPGEKMLVGILIAKAEIYMNMGDYFSAQNLLIQAMTGFPFDPRRSDTLYRMVQTFKHSDASIADRLLVTSLAVEVMKTDPKVVDLLMELARSYEDLGLYEDAHENYAKVALLRTVDSMGRTHAPDTARVMEALLGSARCMLEMGNYGVADRLLREICHSAEAGETFAQAAYLWASIAFRKNQYQEAERRLSLIDTSRCSPGLKLKVDLDRLLLDVAADRKEPQQAIAALDGYEMLSDVEKLEFGARAYRICFERMLHARDIEGMQEFIDKLAQGSHGLPLSKWVMQMASVIMEDKGREAFIKALRQNEKYMETALHASEFDIAALTGIAESVDEIIGKVNDYTR